MTRTEMKGLRSPAWLRAMLMGVALCGWAGAHCGSVPLNSFATVTIPAPGMSVQTICQGGGCFSDTFYRDTLLEWLVQNYTTHKYAAVAYVDSIFRFIEYDTLYHTDVVTHVTSIDRIDTMQAERIWITFDRDLKAPLPVRGMAYVDKWILQFNDSYADTYATFIDTPFVAFFDAYGSITDLGIMRTDGCFYEPTEFSVVNGGIHSKGSIGERMPGISVGWNDFFAALGLSAPEAPPVRASRAALRPLPAGRRGNPQRSGFSYDVRGRRLVYRSLESVVR